MFVTCNDKNLNKINKGVKSFRVRKKAIHLSIYVK